MKVDSDTAYQVAEKNGGSKLTSKDPKQPVFFVLDWDAPKNELVWHVIYGAARRIETARCRKRLDRRVFAGRK